MSLSSTSIATLVDLPEAAAVDEAATKALELVKQLATTSKDDDPDEMYAQLDQARNDVLQAWDNLEQVLLSKTNEREAGTATLEDMRPAFIDMITDAFADVLEDLRQNSTEIDVDVLVDCLQSGMELFAISNMSNSDFVWNLDEEEGDEDDEMNNNNLFNNDDASDSNNLDGNTSTSILLTPHELRRRQLGYHQRDRANANVEAAAS